MGLGGDVGAHRCEDLRGLLLFGGAWGFSWGWVHWIYGVVYCIFCIL